MMKTTIHFLAVFALCGCDKQHELPGEKPIPHMTDGRSDLPVEKRIDDGESDLEWPPDDFTGVWEVYWPNGTLKLRATYIKGQEDGEYLCLWENGKVAQRGLMVAGKSDGVWTDYNKDGNKTLEGKFGQDGKRGIWRSFWADGTVMKEEEYESGAQNGFFREYDSEGKLLHEGEYRNDMPYSGECLVFTNDQEEDYHYYAEFEEGREIRRLAKRD